MAAIYTKVKDNAYKFYKDGTYDEMISESLKLRARANKKKFDRAYPVADDTGIKILYYGNNPEGSRICVEVHLCCNDRELKKFKVQNGLG